MEKSNINFKPIGEKIFKKIMANKTWRDPQKRCITTGPNRNIPYKGEIPLKWLPAER